MPARVHSLDFPAPDGAGGGSGGTGAEAQWHFLPEPDTRKTRLTRAAAPRIGLCAIVPKTLPGIGQ